MEQKKVLKKVAGSPHLLAAMTAMGKSEEGMSNAEVDDAISNSSEWTTIWVIRQLTSLGFIEFRVDFFGNPARYQLTETGRAALSVLTGQPSQKPLTPTPPAPQPAAPKAA
jgi:hypothetical protein